MKESEYQKKLIDKIKAKIPDCIVLKNDSSYLQGVPDLSVMRGSQYAFLEVKVSRNASHQPNQDFYINKTSEQGGFATFVYPENEEEVLNNLVDYFYD